MSEARVKNDISFVKQHGDKPSGNRQLLFKGVGGKTRLSGTSMCRTLNTGYNVESIY